MNMNILMLMLEFIIQQQTAKKNSGGGAQRKKLKSNLNLTELDFPLITNFI